MPETLLSYLTHPNPRIACRASGSSTFTFNAFWSPVENIEPWTEFNYRNLTSLFSPDLNRQVDLSDPTPQCEAAMFNQLYDEQMLGHLVASSIMMPVSCALPDELFFTSGGTTWETAECFPDWSTGNKNRTQRIGRPKAIAIGDTKYQWAHEEAISVVRSNPHGYEYANRRDIVRPIEQLQFYCASYKCRFGFLITEKGLLVLEASLETEIQRSPRPPRNVQPPSHRRVTSSSTVDKSVSGISEALTDMSVDSSIVAPSSIRLLKYAFVPWGVHGVGNLTVKLALYCISRIANEGSDLKPDYAPLTTIARLSAGSPRQIQAPTTPIGSSQVPSSPAEKGKAVSVGVEGPMTSTSSPTTSDRPKFLDVKVFWNNNHTGYKYQLDGKWVFNDSPDKWQTLGGKIYNYTVTPYLRADKPS